MELERINPELRRLYRWLPHIRMDYTWVLRLLRFLPAPPTPARDREGVEIEDHQLATAGLRTYIPRERHADAALLWIHGGGMIIGSNVMNDRECIRYAKELGILVASVEYRLAPEHPFPAPLDDCHAAWAWLQERAGQLQIDRARIVVSGQSAGGGLAASLAQRVFDAGGVQPVGQALFCPMLDDRTAARRELDVIRHKLWNNQSNRAGWSHYLGHPAGEPEERKHAVPARRDDLAGLPQAWIGIGDADLFLEESQDYRARLEAAGTPCDFYTAPGGFHGFEGLAPDAQVVRDLYASNFAFLRRVLDLPG